MGRRALHFTQDAVSRAVKGALGGGLDVRGVKISPDGSIVILVNADAAGQDNELEKDLREKGL